jgi:DNA-directed RNA polymerase specialized sigma24 family protein
MPNENILPDPTKSGHANEQMWQELQIWLLRLVEQWVWQTHLPLWHGQEKEIAEEITQETMMRAFQYSQKAATTNAPPINSLKAFGRVIARNYLHDRRRKDSRILRYDQVESNKQLGISSIADPSEIAIDHVMLATIITKAAHIIAHFPPRQKTALLTDLANISDLDGGYSLLEQILAEEGIRLYDYKQPRSGNAVERQRHASLVYAAYKRFKEKFKE